MSPTYRDIYRREWDYATNRLRWEIVHSWQEDARQRLAWLYGDATAREAENAPDVAAWRRLTARSPDSSTSASPQEGQR